MVKIKDSFVLILCAGLVGTASMALSNFIRFKRNTSELLYGHIAGSIILAPFRLNRRKNFIIGQFYHFVSGVIIAYPLYYLFKTTGTDYYRLKGGAFGLFTWGTLFNVGKRMKLFAQPRLTRTYYSAIQNNLIYGIVTAEAMIRLADPLLFKPKTVPVVKQLP